MKANLSRLILAMSAVCASGQSESITFPIGTPITVNAQQVYRAHRHEIQFSRANALSINLFSNASVHLGGLKAPIVAYPDPAPIDMRRSDSNVFALERVVALETPGSGSSPSLVLVITGHQTNGTTFSADFPFDSNPATYDTFQLLPADVRFAAVDWVNFRLDSPTVEAKNYIYLLDTLTVVYTPTPSVMLVSNSPAGAIFNLQWANLGEAWRYTLESSSNLAPTSWAPIAGTVWPIATNDFDHPVPAEADRHFYRLHISPLVP